MMLVSSEGGVLEVSAMHEDGGSGGVTSCPGSGMLDEMEEEEDGLFFLVLLWPVAAGGAGLGARVQRQCGGRGCWGADDHLVVFKSTLRCWNGQTVHSKKITLLGEYTPSSAIGFERQMIDQ